MIDFYTYGTINGKAIAIALEEMDLPYRSHWIDLTRGQQQSKSFLKLNPSGRIPVIVDHSCDPAVTVSQTGAILLYLAEKSNTLLPERSQDRAKVIEALMFQLTDITVNIFNNFYLKSLVSPKQPAAGELLKQRAVQFYQVFEQQLQNQPYLAGEQLSIADVAAFPVVDVLQDVLFIDCPHLSQWHKSLAIRAAFINGMKPEE